MSKDELFKELSLEAAIPVEVIQKVYNALVRVTVRELRENTRIRLPHIGRLIVSHPITRTFPHVQTGVSVTHTYYKTAFTVDKELKNYINMVFMKD